MAFYFDFDYNVPVAFKKQMEVIMKQSKKIVWYNLAFMAFSSMWSFGNIVNGFVYFNGIQVIFSWIMMFALYFVPYTLMVGELGSAFENAGGGVSSWIHETLGPKLAYYAGWTTWVVHMPYIASKSSAGLKALSWVLFQDSSFYDSLDTWVVQLMTLVIFLVFAYIVSKGLNPLKSVATLASSSLFIISLLFIVLMLAAPVINPQGGYQNIDWSLHSFIPEFRLEYFTSLSILVFAVGGSDRMSPYVNKVENPSKGFPKGMIALAIMVIVSAILGTVSMSMMFNMTDVQANFDAYVANGAYWAFQKLGEYYGVGHLFLILYALCTVVGQLSTLLIAIDAPIRMLLDNEYARDFIPSKLFKRNKHGAYVNGIWLVVAIVTPLIMIPALGIGHVTTIIKQLTQLNSVTMPLRFLWVFIAYIALRQSMDKFPAEYRFTRNQKLAKFFGIWCLIVTLFSCAMGMLKGSLFEIAMNILTPVMLVGLGMIMPTLVKRQRNEGNSVEKIQEST